MDSKSVLFFSSFSGCWVISNFVIFPQSCETYLGTMVPCHLVAKISSWFILIVFYIINWSLGGKIHKVAHCLNRHHFWPSDFFPVIYWIENNHEIAIEDWIITSALKFSLLALSVFCRNIFKQWHSSISPLCLTKRYHLAEYDHLFCGKMMLSVKWVPRHPAQKTWHSTQRHLA